MYNNNKAFILHDLLLTISVISILAAVAVPAYKDYITKSQVAEASLLTVSVKKNISDYYAYHGRFPANNQAAGVSENVSGNYVSRINVTNGIIQVTFGHHSDEKIAGQTVSFQPIVKGNFMVGIVNWKCNSSTLIEKYSPPPC